MTTSAHRPSMELIEVALTFAGLSLVAAIPLVALLHSADTWGSRRSRHDRPG
jgi:hypothetical protein